MFRITTCGKIFRSKCGKILRVRSAAHGDIVVPSHPTDWGMRSFAMAGPVVLAVEMFCRLI